MTTASLLQRSSTSDRYGLDAIDQLHRTMRTTVKCRYNAALRLQQQRGIAFTVALLSTLGLLFLPTLQNSGIPLAFKGNFLNILQAFFAIVTLLYLTLILAARHATRASQLTACADRLEVLIRELDSRRGALGGPALPEQLAEFQDRYAAIVIGVEDHSMNDFRLAFLAMREDYGIGGMRRLRMALKARTVRAAAFAPAALFLVVELVVITDVLGITHVASSYLTSAAPMTLLHIAS